MPYLDVFNKCISGNPTKLGGIVAGTNIFGAVAKKSETYDYKYSSPTGATGTGMSASGVYSTGGINESGLVARLADRFDKPRYYSGDTSS